MEMLELKISNPHKQFAKPAEVKTKNFTDEEKRRLAKASVEFEGLLTQMMLKSMTQTTEGGLLGKSEGLGSDVFSSIFEGELADYMSKSQSMGIASMLYEKMTGEKLDMNELKLEELKRKAFSFDKKANINENEKLVPHKSALERLKKYESLVEKIAGKYGVDDSLIKSVILAESSAKHDAVSRANAKGLMQLMDITAEELGVQNPFDPVENVEGGTKYIARLLKDFGGELDSALAAYNAGPDNVKKYGGVPPFEETQNYVKRVKGYLKYFKGE